MYIDTVSVITESKLIDINGKDIIDYGKKLTININEKQKRLVMCLFNDVNRKKDLIKVVWYENHKGISDNNYHQLIHKFRILLDEFGIPSSIIKTINRYRLRLDTSLLRSSMNSKCHDRFNGYHQSNN